MLIFSVYCAISPAAQLKRIQLLSLRTATPAGGEVARVGTFFSGYGWALKSLRVTCGNANNSVYATFKGGMCRIGSRQSTFQKSAVVVCHLCPRKDQAAC